MIRHKQLFRHEPEKGIYGDCHRTALACILNLPSPEHAPHFIGEWEAKAAASADGKPDDGFSWQEAQAEWLDSLGYCTADICFNGEVPVEDVFAFMEARNPDIYYLLGGQSPRGTNHSIICHGGGFEWDPHPDGGFLVGPMDNGVWEITFILPNSMRF